MIAEWINEAVRVFGHQLGLKNFSLNEHGAAGCRFENGIAFYLEYTDGAMMMSAGIETDDSDATMKKFLSLAHPAARTGGVRLRAVRIAKAGESRYLARIADRELTPTALEATFHALWQAVDYLKGALA